MLAKRLMLEKRLIKLKQYYYFRISLIERFPEYMAQGDKDYHDFNRCWILSLGIDVPRKQVNHHI